MFYSTLHCADVKNERCIEHNITGNATCNVTTEIQLEKEIDQTFEGLQQKTEEMKINLTSLELQNRILGVRLASLQQNYTEEERMIKMRSDQLRTDMSYLHGNISTLEQHKTQLSNETRDLEMEKQKLSTARLKDKCLLGDDAIWLEVFLFVLGGALSILTVILAILYIRARSAIKQHLPEKRDFTVSNNTITTTC